MPTAYSRVTLVNGTRRVDLALPGALPLADVMPQLLRFCAPDERPEEPASWTLGRLGGPNFSLSSSLDDLAISDGEVLELRTASTVVHTAYVEDVRDAVEDAVDESGRQWRSGTTVGFSLGLAAAVLAAAVLLPEARLARDSLALSVAILVAALGILGGWWADRKGHRQAAQAVVATAVLWGGLAGWLACTFPRWEWTAALGGAVVGGLVVAALARSVTPVATAHLATTAVLCVAGLPIAGLTLGGYDALTAVRVDGVLGVLVIGVLPRMSLTVGGLASADYRVRNFGLVTSEELTARIRRSTALLHGSIAGVSVIGLTAGLVLTAGDTLWDRLLGLAIGLALLLRSRVFTRIPHILPLRAAGVVVLLFQGLRAARDLETGPTLIAATAALATLVVALAGVPMSDVARAQYKRMLNLAESIAVAGMIALAGAALGVYEWVRQISQ